MDMTVECIFAKLAYLLGKGHSVSKITRLMKTNLRGELTDKSREKAKFSMQNNTMVMAIAQYLKKDKNQAIGKSITPVLVNSLISIGNLTSLKQLHSDGADLNAVDYLGRSALSVVAANGNIKIAEYLISTEACDLNLVNNNEVSPLFVSIQNSNEQVSLMLIKKGAKLVAPDDEVA